MSDATSVDSLSDVQSVLLWQACAHAEDLIDATNSHRDAGPARGALVKFIHYNVYPYLRFEEVEVSDWARPGSHLSDLQVADHDRIRLVAETIETSRTRADLALAVPSLVDRLNRHIQREQTWVADCDLAVLAPRLDAGTWTPPLLPRDGIPIPDLSGQGGDPACWAHRVCAGCGRLNDDTQEVDTCTACGELLPDGCTTSTHREGPMSAITEYPRLVANPCEWESVVFGSPFIADCEQGVPLADLFRQLEHDERVRSL